MHVIYLYFTQCVLLHITGGYRSQEYITVVINHSDESTITVNGERFAGLNFHVFSQFFSESFPVNIHFIIQASCNGVVLVL